MSMNTLTDVYTPSCWTSTPHSTSYHSPHTTRDKGLHVIDLDFTQATATNAVTDVYTPEQGICSELAQQDCTWPPITHLSPPQSKASYWSRLHPGHHHEDCNSHVDPWMKQSSQAGPTGLHMASHYSPHRTYHWRARQMGDWCTLYSGHHHEGCSSCVQPWSRHSLWAGLTRLHMASHHTSYTTRVIHMGDWLRLPRPPPWGLQQMYRTAHGLASHITHH